MGSSCSQRQKFTMLPHCPEISLERAVFKAHAAKGTRYLILHSPAQREARLASNH